MGHGRHRRRHKSKWRHKQQQKLQNTHGGGCCYPHGTAAPACVTRMAQTVEEWQSVALQAFGFKPKETTDKTEAAPFAPVSALPNPVAPDASEHNPLAAFGGKPLSKAEQAEADIAAALGDEPDCYSPTAWML